MAELHDSIDLRTLEQVQHLLATTTFASIDDLAGRIDRTPADRSATRTPDRGSSLVDSAGAAPLPRRR